MFKDYYRRMNENIKPDTQLVEKTIGLMHQTRRHSKLVPVVVLVALFVMLSVTALVAKVLTGEWLWPANNPGNHYTQATADPNATTESGKPTTSASTYSEDQLAFSDKANAQFALMEQAHITDQYKYYAGCYIEDLQVFIINVTCKPEEFKTKYADLLDFSIIEVRQVKYTLKELELAYAPLFEEFSSSDKLTKLGVFGMAVFEQDNAIKIVVSKVTDKIRQAVAEIIPDTGMVAFEVNGETFPY